MDNLKRAWRQIPPATPPRDPRQALASVRERARQLDATVRRRDRVETLTALALLPVFAYFALQAEAPLVRLGAAVVAAACILIPVRLRGARHAAPDAGLPVAAFLRRELEVVESQRRLLLTVPVWYLGPLGVGVILFFAGAVASIWWTLLYTTIVIATFGWLYRLNRRAVTSELDPRADELRTWISSVDQDRQFPLEGFEK